MEKEKHPALETKKEKVDASLPQMTGVSLDPAIQAAIQAAVSSAVASVVGQLVQQAPQLNVAPAPIAVRPTRLNPNPPPPQTDYKTKLKGIPVEPGQDLRHVHPAEINAWFRGIEERAKQRMMEQGGRNGTQANMSWTRG